MQKSKTAARKAKSTRNRHNGRINAHKQWVLDNGGTFAIGNTAYKGVISKTKILHDIEDKEGGFDMLIKSQIVRMPQVLGAIG